jgi:cell division protein FtsI/penicillin-binding protein 2
MKLHLLDSVYNKYKYKNKELNKVKTEDKYLKRVQQGFKEVLKYGGTGSGYIDLKYKPAGKTGTSQSFVDTNNDGKIDKETITTTFVSYAPYDNPRVTFTVVSPDISNYDHNSSYQSNINSRLMRRISKLYFDKYDK